MQLEARSEANGRAVCGELNYVAYLQRSGTHYSIVEQHPIHSVFDLHSSSLVHADMNARRRASWKAS